MPSFCYRLSIHRTRTFGRRLRPFRRNKFGFRKGCLSLSLHFRLKTACMRVCDHMSMPPARYAKPKLPLHRALSMLHPQSTPEAYSECLHDPQLLERSVPFLSREDQSPKPLNPVRSWGVLAALRSIASHASTNANTGVLLQNLARTWYRTLLKRTLNGILI